LARLEFISKRPADSRPLCVEMAASAYNETPTCQPNSEKLGHGEPG
jgi:hypothetical protein